MEQSFIELNYDENFMLMLSMYEKEIEITIYVTTNKNISTNNSQQSPQLVIEEPHGEGDSDKCPSDESYFSHLSSDDNNGHDDDVEISSDKTETNSNRKKSITMKENSKFQNVLDFRRALNHHAVINEFEYFTEKSDHEH